MARVTHHFDSSEFDQRAWSGGSRKVYPTKWIEGRLGPLCAALELLRDDLGGKPMSILSGYRSEEFNKAIQGAPRSQHVAGRAADVRVVGIPSTEVHEVLMRLVMAGDVPQVRGVGLYVRQNFVHVDVRPTVRLATWGGADWTPSES